jgi:hypothetical protein
MAGVWIVDHEHRVGGRVYAITTRGDGMGLYVVALRRPEGWCVSLGWHSSDRDAFHDAVHRSQPPEAPVTTPAEQRASDAREAELERVRAQVSNRTAPDPDPDAAYNAALEERNRKQRELDIKDDTLDEHRAAEASMREDRIKVERAMAAPLRQAEKAEAKADDIEAEAEQVRAEADDKARELHEKAEEKRQKAEEKVEAQRQKAQEKAEGS